MAEPKRGSVEAFKAAEERRKARVASKENLKFLEKQDHLILQKKQKQKESLMKK
jgi:hypothetical protein